MRWMYSNVPQIHNIFERCSCVKAVFVHLDHGQFDECDSESRLHLVQLNEICRLMQETHDFVVYRKRQLVICLIQDARLTLDVRRTDRDRHCLALSESSAALNLQRYTGRYWTTRACFGVRTASASRATSCQSQHVQIRMSSSTRCSSASSRD